MRVVFWWLPLGVIKPVPRSGRPAPYLGVIGVWPCSAPGWPRDCRAPPMCWRRTHKRLVIRAPFDSYNVWDVEQLLDVSWSVFITWLHKEECLHVNVPTMYKYTMLYIFIYKHHVVTNMLCAVASHQQINVTPTVIVEWRSWGTGGVRVSVAMKGGNSCNHTLSPLVPLTASPVSPPLPPKQGLFLSGD